MAAPNRNQRLAFDRLKSADATVEIQWDAQLGTPRRLRGKLTAATPGEPQAIAHSFLVENKALFNLSTPESDLRLKDTSTDARGNRHIRFQQMYRNLPVFGYEVVVHLDNTNSVKGFNGRTIGDFNLSERSRITVAQARRTILGDSADNHELPGQEPVLLVLVREGTPHLCWHMVVAGADAGLDGSEVSAEWAYFIDAHSGEIVWRYNALPTHTRTTGAGSGKYSGSVTVNTIHNHTTAKYELEDQWVTTGARIRTHDANGGYPPATLSEDGNNNWSAAAQGPDVDCHYYSRIVFDYWLAAHGRNSYDNAGADMEIYANCGNNWNNASWSPSQQLVKIGNGDGVDKDSYCTLDIVAHEWTHAVTEHTAGLVYANESGALNESISDVFAAIIDGNWLQGEDNFLKTTAPAERNLADPTNGGQYDPADPITSVLDGHQPDHMDDKYTGGVDNGGVHINSGIMNKAAYLISVGGTHRGIAMCAPLGNDALGELYYQALQAHLTPSSDFEDMRDALLDSLDDLYTGDPRHARWAATITNAFAAVGIGAAVTCPLVLCWIAPAVCPPSPHILCPPAPTMMCPPSPSLACPPSPHIMCPPAPSILCPPSPIMMCPPSPMLTCPPAPDIIRGCLPGPDPGPFNPGIIEKTPVVSRIVDIQKVSGIGAERAAILKGAGIETVEQFIRATSSEEAVKKLSTTIGISAANLRTWRTRGQLLIKRR